MESVNARAPAASPREARGMGLLTRIAEQSAKALFAAYGIELRSSPVEAPAGRAQELRLVGMGGFTSPALLGCLLLGASDEPLHRSNSTGTPREDWFAELTNQWLGRTKNQLLREGILVTAIRPVVIDGQALSPAPARPFALAHLYETASGGLVYIGVDGEVPSVQETEPVARDPSEEILLEGDAIMF